MNFDLLKKPWKEVSYLLRNDLTQVLKNLPYKCTLNLDVWLKENDPLDYL